jgi:hypothetical protein
MAGERIEISLSYYTDAVTASFAQRFMDGYVATLKVHDEQPYERQI